ncbi:MAG: AAA domain-containing protein [Pseudonocardia sp.]
MGVLRQLAAAKFTPTRHTDQYLTTVWLDHLRRCGAVDSPAGPGDVVARVSSVILEPEPPRPAELEHWLQPRRDDLAEPRLRSVGPVDDVDTPIEDAPGVRRAFDSWIAVWRRWAAEERSRRERKQAYDELFDVHRLAVEQPESVELVLAAGLLHVPSAGDARGLRVHILSQAVEVEQDLETGDMVCTLAPESGIRLEDDEILSGLDGFDLSGSSILRDKMLEQVTTPLDPALPEFLKEWSARVLQIRYQHSDTWSSERPSGPAVSTSPAIIARRRGAFAIRTFYDAITRTLADPHQPVPLGLAQLVEAIEPEDRVAWLERSGATAPAALTEQPLFPLPANEEQAQIFSRLGHDSGVVVEGPPGTGKTHTIANLVCALLAQGQRVLVTSEKAQALRVLRDKLPAGMQELCVSLTDASAKGDSDLNRSVGTLASRKADFNPSRLQREIDDLTRKRDAAVSRRSTLLEGIRAVREAETFVHPEVAPGFRGTLSQIADRLNETAADCWLGTGVTGELPLSAQELDELLGLLREETEERIARRAQRLPAAGLIPPVERFAAATAAIRAGDAARSDGGDGLVGVLETLPPDHLARLDPLCLEITEHTAALRNLPRYRDVAPAVVDRLLGHGDLHTWQRALAELPVVDEAVGRDRAAGFAQVTSDGSVDPSAAAAALGAWATELEQGGRQRSLFKSATQKAAEPYFPVVRVDGRPSSAAGDARTAEHDLCVGMIARHLRNVFGPFGFDIRFDGPRSALVEQALAIRVACGAIEAVRSAVDRARQMVATLPPDARPRLRSLAEAARLASLAQGVAHARRAALARAELDIVAERIRHDVPPAERSPETQQLLDAIAAAEDHAFNEAIRALQRAEQQVSQQARCDELYARAHRASASLAVELRRDPGADTWPGRLRRWPQAWARSVTATWLDSQVAPGREQELEAALEVVTSDLAKYTADLAAARAWLTCLTRMTAAQVQALQSYRNCMANVGKGTGLYAERYRQAARDAMQVAQAAVPAWVMPIRQVLASTPPTANAFDVVIVDEASQAELTSAFLLWLAPRVIVVGDDKQCTPSEVASGALQPIFDRLDAELHDFPSYLRTSFTPKDSVFSVLRSRFGQVIRLREHFRCMPEIIAWCSNMFYRDAPLVPLRQFGADRLDPLRTVHVRGAEAEGTSSSARNRAEADAIAGSVAACLQDDAYDGKTFGIVVLQGQAQADVIRNALLQYPAVAEQWDERRIRVGTPPDFQGDERHVVWLSMVRAPNSPNSSLTRREFEQRFNVAVSRAQDQLWLFHSVTLDLLRPGDLRRELLDYMTSTGAGIVPPLVDGVTRGRRHPEFDSLLEQRVYLDLIARGFHVTPQVESNGRRIDLVVTGAAGKLAVECDGDAFHTTPEQRLNDLHREQELKRCGWTFERIRGSEYTLDPERAMAPVWATLDRLGIGPLGKVCDGSWTPWQQTGNTFAEMVDAESPAPVTL